MKHLKLSRDENGETVRVRYSDADVYEVLEFGRSVVGPDEPKFYIPPVNVQRDSKPVDEAQHPSETGPTGGPHLNEVEIAISDDGRSITVSAENRELRELYRIARSCMKTPACGATEGAGV